MKTTEEKKHAIYLVRKFKSKNLAAIILEKRISNIKRFPFSKKAMKSEILYLSNVKNEINKL